MTNSPTNLIAVRKIYQRYTGLPAVSLGIQHFQAGGGGYHEGDDLLAAGNRLTTDYSKRESALDRNNRVDPNDACAIDIGWFDVTLSNGRRVTLRDRSQWVIAHWDEAPWLRELIYSPDGKVVKRKDRLARRTTGDKSHLTHDHESYFRSMVRDSRIPAFHQRFWDEMNGDTDVNGEQNNWLVEAAVAARRLSRNEHSTTDPTVEEMLKALLDRPAVQPAPIDVDSLKAALQDPEVRQTLVSIINEAEDS